MKRILIIILVFTSMNLFSKTAEEYISSAFKVESSDIFKATEIMEKASEEYPENADVLSVYALMLSKSAGQVSFLKAGMISSKAEKTFNKALEIEADHKDAILWRGILRINLPKFLGKLDKGIADLTKSYSRAGISNDDYLLASYYLGHAYIKKGDSEQAVEFFKNVVRYGVDSPFYQDSIQQLTELTEKKAEDTETDVNFEAQADKYIEQEDYLNAYKLLTEATKQDTSNIELHLKYLNVIRVVSEDGYDEKTYEEVAFMSDLAFNVAYTLRRIVAMMPDNEDFHLLKAEVLSQLPFFVKSLDEAKEEALWVINNSSNSDNIQSAEKIKTRVEERTQRMELTDRFIASVSEKEKEKLVTKMQFDKTEAKKPDGMLTEVTLSLGFGDYIAPQTAVWVENDKGNFIAPIYISAFSANIKEKQVHLPTWAKKSNFDDSLVKVTGASIDSGKHIFYWDNKDTEGNLLMRGDYYVYAEVSHWPHANYSIKKVKLSLGGKSYRQTTKGDWIISELKVEY